jgi:hypothetical protein
MFQINPAIGHKHTHLPNSTILPKTHPHACARKDQANAKPLCGSPPDGWLFWNYVNRSAGTLPRFLPVLLAIRSEQAHACNQHHS